MFRRNTFVILVLSLVVLVLAGCGGSRKWEDMDATQAWKKIQKVYNKGAYLDASERLELFLINFGGSSIVDSAQFLLGEAHFKMKEYIIAAAEYEKMMIQFPQSHLAEESEYKLGLCYYEMSPKPALDQQYTAKAIDAFQLFIEDYPQSPRVDDATEMIGKCRWKLAGKEFRGGRLYHKMGEYSSARIYYNEVLNNYYDTEYAPKAQYYKALSFLDSDRYDEAIAEFRLFLEKYQDHDYGDRALNNLNISLDKASRAAVKN